MKSGVLRAAWCAALLGASNAAAQETMVLRGRVVEAGTGTGVAAAEVRAVGRHERVLSSADGAFMLRLPEGTHEIIVEHLGYAGTVLRVGRDTAGLTVQLTPRAISLADVVVTASRRLQSLKDVPVATEVVSRDEIAQSGAADLSAVLVERTGIGAEGGHPIGSGVMLQGLGGERVLVLIDGQPMIGRISGGLDLSRIPAATVERVEVVKGPQSTLYGSDAMGGVVNVITRSSRGRSREAALGITAGSHDRLDLTASALGGIGDLAYSASGGRRTIELVPGHAGSAGTFATRLDGSGRVEWTATPSLSVHAGALLLDESQRWGGGVLYHFADNLQWSARAGAAYASGAHHITPTFYATEFRHLSRRSTLPEPVASESDETEIQRLLEAELLYNFAGDGIAVDAGVEARREAIHSDRVTGRDRALHTVEPFAQATLSGDAWSVVPGARLSWSEQWGVHATPRIAAMLRPTDRVALRLSAGRGYRAPSFKELYMEFLNTAAGAGYRVRGNPELEPETSNNVSGSIEWTGERLYTRAQLFYNRFDDFIEAREVNDGGALTLYVYGNIDDGETWGTELDAGATWGGLRAEAGYGWLRAVDRTTGQTLLGRPRHSARASLTYALPFGLRASAIGVYTGSTPSSRDDEGNVATRAALTRLDVRAAQALPHGLEISAGIDNVFDAQVDGYPGYLGRQLHIALGWTAGREH